MPRRFAVIPFVAAFATCAATAQIPFDHLLIAEWGDLGSARPALRVLDPATGDVRELTHAVAGAEFWGAHSVSIDPSDSRRFLFNGDDGFALSLRMREATLTGSTYATVDHSTAPFPVDVRIAPRHGAAYTLGRGGALDNLWASDLGAPPKLGPAPGYLLPPSPTGVAVLGDRFYACSTSGDVLEWNRSTLTTRLMALNDGAQPVSLGPLTALNEFGTGALIAGDANGVVYFIDPATDLALPFVSTGMGPITGICSNAAGLAYVSIDNTATTGTWDVFAVFDLSAPIYSSTFPIDDIDISRDPSFATFGAPCQGSAGRARFEFVDTPVLGATWTLRAHDAPPSTPASLMLGRTRAAVDLSPIGATGCGLHVATLIAVLPLMNTDPAGRVETSFPIGANQTLIGAAFTAQWAIIDIGANPLGVVTTNGAEGVVRQ